MISPSPIKRRFRPRDLLLPAMIAAPALIAALSVPAHAQMNGQAQQAIQKACGADIQKLCAGVQPGGGRIVQCMKAHEAQVSEGCKSTMAALKAQRAQ
ncbi:hypothetical protein GCM10007301_38680 [Azorhizobium oxalatiphilum]|uniref:Cysteine rich repeat-containing protein n=1 Tax=Azorhizobium oxalatiphilum TaxID=980631 RepID=A0A917C6Y8_9HYPH|nr:cysteine rich repeat-containing protein [Azorhizobium oxalatiphilum]GGF75063.1 hypothetical protein GCM10007301_38680 [Azorhizobium oxalatiphilum]